MDAIDRETLLERLRDSRKSYEARASMADFLGLVRDAGLYGSTVKGLSTAIDIVNKMSNCGEEVEDAAPEGSCMESEA